MKPLITEEDVRDYLKSIMHEPCRRCRKCQWNRDCPHAKKTADGYVNCGTCHKCDKFIPDDKAHPSGDANNDAQKEIP